MSLEGNASIEKREDDNFDINSLSLEFQAMAYFNEP